MLVGAFILLKLFTANQVSWWWIVLFMAIDTLRAPQIKPNNETIDDEL
jgi:hypothetical protein